MKSTMMKSPLRALGLHDEFVNSRAAAALPGGIAMVPFYPRLWKWELFVQHCWSRSQMNKCKRWIHGADMETA